MKEVEQKNLNEYRCRNCNKLLCKGKLSGTQAVLQVKCRGCGRVCNFSGAVAEIVSVNAELIKLGEPIEED